LTKEGATGYFTHAPSTQGRREGNEFTYLNNYYSRAQRRMLLLEEEKNTGREEENKDATFQFEQSQEVLLPKRRSEFQ